MRVSNSLLFMHGQLRPIRLIHLTGRKSLYFEKQNYSIYVPIL